MYFDVVSLDDVVLKPESLDVALYLALKMVSIGSASS